ncbi:unnamed protein product [Cuscuta epithymum]|uniref:Retrotransposon Copia-like N-terminal domain-containing protein n=1 Tax=Cuscuta epithymum TaxID=186058 RepID=A0AAV0F499_9ASTE|nr:unnamed protein product [Cuscuta epithymum]
MSSSKNSFHPALAISNIKNFIPLTLDLDNGDYASWAELFKITARAYEVLDHIIPSTTTTDSSSAATDSSLTDAQRAILDAAKAEASALWSRLDAVVLQWIYGTISHDLLHTIIEVDSTAHDAWESLADLFHDNKHARALYLENEFSNTRLDQFPNVSAYCRGLKDLSTKLKNVGVTVGNDRLVLRMVNGLSSVPDYNMVASLIQQREPLPVFSRARSMVVLEESRRNQSSGSPATALIHSTGDITPPGPSSSQRGGRGGSSRGGSRGRSSSQRGGRGRQPGRADPAPAPGQWPQPPPWAYWLHPQAWPSPPCPYPGLPWHAQPGPRPSPGAGLLGPRPQQAHLADASPTALTADMQTMTLSPPGGQWYMDTGASSNMAAQPDGHSSHEV